MENPDSQPQTVVEMVLALLEDRFPWLGTTQAVSGADVIDELNELNATLEQTRAARSQCQSKGSL